MRARVAMAVGAAVVAAAPVAQAVPGPDTVFVVANAAVPESVKMAQEYAAARSVPGSQVCAIALPTGTDVALDAFGKAIASIQACLAAGGPVERVEAAVIARGVPLRVEVPVPGGVERVSFAAALGAWRSTVKADGGTDPLVGRPPGKKTTCGGGTPCYAAAWKNPYRDGTFEAGWTRDQGGVAWAPLLVTMLHGRSWADAQKLALSAIEAEAKGGAPGEFLFMDGADPARAALDVEYDAVVAKLADRGLAASRTKFDADLVGRKLAAFFTGTAAIGKTIEGNTYLAGSVVDNLTSLGAVPVNFEPSGEAQVSIARWVAMGVAGVHGATDEPLNNVFPSRALAVDWADGCTLAEAYHRNLPYAYWRNLVLGDPMAAPYAKRPVVTIAGVADGETVAGARAVSVTATDPAGRGIDRVRLLAGGKLAAEAQGGSLVHCLVAPPGESVQVLAVAQAADDGSPQGACKPKGWRSVVVKSVAGPAECPPAATDAGADAAGAADSGADAGSVADAQSAGDGGADAAAGDPAGCSCRAGRLARRGRDWAPWLAAALAAIRARGPGGRRRNPPARHPV